MAHYIRNKNADEFRDLYPRTVKAIQYYHYIGDSIDSVNTAVSEYTISASTLKKLYY